MKTIMNINQLKTIQELEQFLLGTQPVAFCLEEHVSAIYRWLQKKHERRERFGRPLRQAPVTRERPGELRPREGQTALRTR